LGLSRALVVVACSLLGLGSAGRVLAAETGPRPGEDAIRRLVDAYEHAIESKDLELFRSVKPNLSPDEEKRLRKAFEGTVSQAVEIRIESIQIDGAAAVARLARRDTLNGSIVSSFQQTLKLSRSGTGWVIDEIGR
jgi:hypothetical protein